MKSSWSQRPGQESDIPEILALIVTAYGGANTTASEDYWRWKHCDNPFGASPVLLAEAGGQIVGVRAFMRWTWTRGATDFPAVRAVDTATHPDWQGKGIFSGLTMALVEQLTAEGVSFVFNTPNEKSRPGYLKMGWQDVGKIPMWVRILRPLSAVATLLGETHPMIRQDDSAVSSDWLDSHEVTELANLESNDLRLHTRKSRDYLRWRYQAIPQIRYQGHRTTRSGIPAAAVTRTRARRGLTELSISDLLLRSGYRGVLAGAALLREIMAGTSAHYAVAVAARGTPQARALLASAFVPVPQTGPAFTVRDLRDPAPAQWQQWRAAIGELELF